MLLVLLVVLLFVLGLLMRQLALLLLLVMVALLPRRLRLQPAAASHVISPCILAQKDQILQGTAAGSVDHHR
jgi:hypothetical protein